MLFNKRSRACGDRRAIFAANPRESVAWIGYGYECKFKLELSRVEEAFGESLA